MDIKQIANECGIKYRHTPKNTREMWCFDSGLELFAQKIIEAEREDCARLCESLHGERNGDCAAAIRSLK